MLPLSTMATQAMFLFSIFVVNFSVYSNAAFSSANKVTPSEASSTMSSSNRQKRTVSQHNYLDDFSDTQQALEVLKRAPGWGKRFYESLPENDDLDSGFKLYDFHEDDEAQDIGKRAPGWGKRDSGNDNWTSQWNKRAPGWGKRVPVVMGKRAPGWGKRAPVFLGKRAPGWGKRAPGWGKRAPGWGKRSSNNDFSKLDNSLDDNEIDYSRLVEAKAGYAKRAPGWGKRSAGDVCSELDSSMEYYTLRLEEMKALKSDRCGNAETTK